MGKKYIIELEDKPFHKGNGDFLYRVKGFNSLVFDMTGIGKLTPYTEPDLEQIRKETYDKCMDKAEILAYKLYSPKIDEAYQRGLSDAWEAARKIWEYGITTLREIFGEGIMRMDYFMKFTASEAIEKIRQYEQEKGEQIQVGDEVNAPFGKAIVVNIDSVAEKIWLVYADGHGGFEYFKDAPTKTGRHFPEIAEVLQKMKE